MFFLQVILALFCDLHEGSNHTVEKDHCAYFEHGSKWSKGDVRTDNLPFHKVHAAYFGTALDDNGGI